MTVCLHLWKLFKTAQRPRQISEKSNEVVHYYPTRTNCPDQNPQVVNNYRPNTTRDCPNSMETANPELKCDPTFSYAPSTYWHIFINFINNTVNCGQRGHWYEIILHR